MPLAGPAPKIETSGAQFPASADVSVQTPLLEGVPVTENVRVSPPIIARPVGDSAGAVSRSRSTAVPGIGRCLRTDTIVGGCPRDGECQSVAADYRQARGGLGRSSIRTEDASNAGTVRLTGQPNIGCPGNDIGPGGTVRKHHRCN